MRLLLQNPYLLILFALLLTTPSGFSQPTNPRFDAEADLLLSHFDSKTDVDDIHSVAAFATIMSSEPFSQINHHAVAGAYGIQEGLYVPANELFEAAFGERWSDAHTNFNQALSEVAELVSETLETGGDVWVAECGQSDFTAALVQEIQSVHPDLDTSSRIHVVQHSNWNESSATPEKLKFVQGNTDYHKIPDGNAVGNGTPGFNTADSIDWKDSISDPKLISLWETAIAIANRYNGQEGRYLNHNISVGGFDFSDMAEVAWILNQEQMHNAEVFFITFGK
ncbi:hypothetical protein [Pelagicoccus sp. SDUM812002]|uniref:hypothetical protein n=1 Tax=Pelagicoccus sp. SDUM812002 TaxID=3041266 RepID=UPI00280D4CD4|nr:hypothetical protein [Pelagicoccus sp. SDUM812002]MDQ8185836.1 hypothetical protein [Pelagicoccus sp. SDUM812002]